MSISSKGLDQLLRVSADQAAQVVELQSGGAGLEGQQQELDRRLATLEAKLNLPSLPQSTATPRSAAPEVPRRSFAELEQQARRRYSRTDAVALHSPVLRAQALARHRTLQSQVQSSRRLSARQWSIAGLGGVLGALGDLCLVGLPRHPGYLGSEGSPGGPLSNAVRDNINGLISDKQRRWLEKMAHVPYDAPHSGGLGKAVSGLCPNNHRLRSLGHDPLLGFYWGVKDTMKGRFTAFDSAGRVIVNDIGPGASLGAALIRQILHLASDLTTERGLPAPLMGLFQLARRLGPHGEALADAVDRMYRQNYDLRHFVAMSLPVLGIEVLVRIGYALDQLLEGRPWQAVLGEVFALNVPRLNRMLLVAHGVAAAANAGKVIISNNLLAVNAPQWLMLARYALPEASWQLIGKQRELQRLIDEDFFEIERRFATRPDLASRDAFLLN